MKIFEIKNFTHRDTLEIKAADWDHASEYGGIVRITQDGGSMHFQHDLTCEQARAMASALIQAAFEAEFHAQDAAA